MKAWDVPYRVDRDSVLGIVIRAAIISSWIVDVDHVFRSAYAIVIAAGVVEGFPVVVDRMRGPSAGEAFGDGERSYFPIGDADALPIYDGAEARIETGQISIVHDQVAGETVRIRLKVEVTTRRSEIVAFNDHAASNASLNSYSPVLHER